MIAKIPGDPDSTTKNGNDGTQSSSAGGTVSMLDAAVMAHGNRLRRAGVAAERETAPHLDPEDKARSAQAELRLQQYQQERRMPQKTPEQIPEHPQLRAMKMGLAPQKERSLWDWLYDTLGGVAEGLLEFIGVEPVRSADIALPIAKEKEPIATGRTAAIAQVTPAPAMQMGRVFYEVPGGFGSWTERILTERGLESLNRQFRSEMAPQIATPSISPRATPPMGSNVVPFPGRSR